MAVIPNSNKVIPEVLIGNLSMKATCHTGLDPRYMECLPRELRECFGYVAYKNNAGAVVEEQLSGYPNVPHRKTDP